MTDKQRAHAEMLTARFSEMMMTKYDAGAKEHGGNLWENSPLYLLDQAIFENIDQFAYLATLRDRLVKMLPCDRIGGCLKVNLRDPLASCKCDPQDGGRIKL